MIVLVGETRSREMIRKLQWLGWGRLWTDRPPTPFEGEPWGFDSGIYADWREGRKFNEHRFMRRVDIAHAVGTPYMAVAPDIVGGGNASLGYSLEWLASLPEWPWFLAVQDEMSITRVAAELDKFAGLFVGGTNRFKATAKEWVQLAHDYKKPCHYGRAGTPQKLQNAIEAGADSCDSSFPLWTTERFDYFARVWLEGHPQMRLDFKEVT